MPPGIRPFEQPGKKRVFQQSVRMPCSRDSWVCTAAMRSSQTILGRAGPFSLPLEHEARPTVPLPSALVVSEHEGALLAVADG